jgi:hypothetical protein
VGDRRARRQNRRGSRVATAREAWGEDPEGSRFPRADARLRQNVARAFGASRRDKNPLPQRLDSVSGAPVAAGADCDSGFSGLVFYAESRWANLNS